MAIKICPECNTVIEDISVTCPSCGYPIEDTKTIILNHETSEIPTKSDAQTDQYPKGSPGGPRVLFILSSVAFLILSCVFYYKGFDKMTNYYNPEYSWRSGQNAYVGGDAYNYIINGTYSTSFFVLATGFMLAGLLLIIIYYLSKSRSKVW